MLLNIRYIFRFECQVPFRDHVISLGLQDFDGVAGILGRISTHPDHRNWRRKRRDSSAMRRCRLLSGLLVAYTCSIEGNAERQPGYDHLHIVPIFGPSARKWRPSDTFHWPYVGPRYGVDVGPTCGLRPLPDVAGSQPTVPRLVTTATHQHGHRSCSLN